MAVLSGTAVPVSLGEGSYAILAPGVRGSASLTRPPDPAARARSRSRDDGTAALDQAFAATHVTEVRRVELVLQPGAGPATGVPRSVEGEEAVELQVPDFGPEYGQLVLAIDENDALSWHLPVDTGLHVQTPAAPQRLKKRHLLPNRALPRPMQKKPLPCQGLHCRIQKAEQRMARYRRPYETG